MILHVSGLVRKSLRNRNNTLHFMTKQSRLRKKNSLLASHTIPFWFYILLFRHVTHEAVTPRVEWRQLCYQSIIVSCDNKLRVMFAGKQYLQSINVYAFPRPLVWLFFFSRAKLKEIKAGADGFLVFDPDLVQPLIQVCNHHFTHQTW